MSNATQQLKAQQRRQKFADLLREMFQLNQPELDFGLYRIMHARKDDINRFIDQDLPRITQEAFSQYASQDQAQLAAELEEHIKSAKGLGMDPDAIPKVQELKQKLQGGFDLAREEGEVYDALVTFFNRYYNEGDFLSRRVYKDGTYAIPYQGEEVVLHWANKDQYYIKSSETLRDYSFRLNPDAGPGEDPMRVHFKLVDAGAGAKDNNKESADSRRVFVLNAENPFELVEGEATEHGDKHTELQCRFLFRPATESDWTETEKKKATAAAQKKQPTQDALRAIAGETLLGAASTLPEPWKSAMGKPYRKADGNRADYSMLAGQLNNYTKKNTFDYFIHKDLGGFLTRELDFYIKNELLDWNDIASLKNDPARLAPLVSKIEVIRSLGERIIAFLAQLENFQKKLWLKKKFVTEAHYCLTLDRLKYYSDLFDEVMSNDAQLEEWSTTYKIDVDDLQKEYKSNGVKSLAEDYRYQYLMVDTYFFDKYFKERLIASFESIDKDCDGLLVNSENFQALNLIKEKYRNRVQCIYIDPPYNTDASPIIYKNGFRSSSWASMLNDRVALGSEFLKSNGIFCATIDDFQFRELSWIIESIFGEESILGTSTIRNNPAGRSTKKGFAIAHEYGIFARKSQDVALGRLEHSEKQKERYKEKDERGRFEWVNFRKHGGANANRSARPKLFYPIIISGDRIRIPEMEWDAVQREWKIIERLSGTQEVIVYPIAEDGAEKTWKWEHASVTESINEFCVRPDRTGSPSVYLKARINEDGTLPLTIWSDSKYSASDYGTNLLKSMFPGEQAFSFPKSVHAVEDSITVSSGSDHDAIVLDYFAGSGTTGHAVINLNRKNGHSKKFCLVEMGEYFREVTLGRLKKVVYSPKWRNGSPVLDGQGFNFCNSSYMFKYMSLESYEDSLGNLSIQRPKTSSGLFSDQELSSSVAHEAYVLNYMLDVETRDSRSLLNTKLFTDPGTYKLNVRSAGGDETKPVNVDLLETFNYLLGLEVEHIAVSIHFEAELIRGEYGRWQAKVKRSETGKWWFRTVYGTNRAGQQVLVVWRNLPSVIDGEADGIQKDNAVLDAVLIEKLSIRLTESQDDEIDVLYVNGDHNISIPRSRKGKPMEQARIQLIEEAFHRLMFADTEAVH
ncbi:site-specific DNA-methyltransferase [Marinobacter salexigens]|uniref:DNA methylase N-4/N-6 domain-containing protein n=1 Tax=Marinobacter salexigens TaxID=1925763 RepID=A0ABS6A9I0_9GAMM|nr:DNA methyltransferase [Marinobacter salexigens]MBU2874160.1 hypothetical protein [Marinobacter salexigens]